jgi:hypothetical protein
MFARVTSSSRAPQRERIVAGLPEPSQVPAECCKRRRGRERLMMKALVLTLND